MNILLLPMGKSAVLFGTLPGYRYDGGTTQVVAKDEFIIQACPRHGALPHRNSFTACIIIFNQGIRSAIHPFDKISNVSNCRPAGASR
jgi:hypothetical protein